MEIDEYVETLEEAEGLLDRLRALYEQYFQGFERLEPHVPRKDLERKIARLRRVPQRNTALRFRFNRLIQKHTTYRAYWRRIARQIEEGTYLRHIMRAREQRSQARDSRLDSSGNSFDLDLDVEVDLEELSQQAATSVDRAVEAAKQNAPNERLFGNTDVTEALSVLKPMTGLPAQRPKRPSFSPFALRSQAPAVDKSTQTIASPAPEMDAPKAIASPGASYRPPVPTALSGGPQKHQRTELTPQQIRRRTPLPPTKQPPLGIGGNSETSMRKVYERYVAARQKNNERTDNVRFESLEKNINKMMPALKKKHGGKKIDFEVVIKNGRVGLKPVPKD